MTPKNPKDINVSKEFMALMPVLAETMKFATQAVAQSSALADVLIRKGVLTKEELDAAMSSVGPLKEKLTALLDAEMRKGN